MDVDLETNSQINLLYVEVCKTPFSKAKNEAKIIKAKKKEKFV